MRKLLSAALAGMFMLSSGFANANAEKIDRISPKHKTVLTLDNLVQSNDQVEISIKTVPCTRKTADGFVVSSEGGCFFCSEKAAKRRCEKNLDTIIGTMTPSTSLTP